MIARRVCATYYQTLDGAGRLAGLRQPPAPTPDYSSLALPWQALAQPDGNGAAHAAEPDDARAGEWPHPGRMSLPGLAKRAG